MLQQLFDLNKSAWVGAAPEAAAPVRAWPPSLCLCPLGRRRYTVCLTGCGGVENRWLGAGAGKVGKFIHFQFTIQ